ncbi:hypothetical protein B0T20DRAFT_179082 [Sordaria brevicollis]|uniref:Uncharacterized protein n=1 Tax=Sordaria brevicollis TaxID=83679 RepID=A0AAE0PHQ0_SORBR|nr:hypothetical protein B0T20DRAFT_179082 [Sordaria brevicollis]
MHSPSASFAAGAFVCFQQSELELSVGEMMQLTSRLFDACRKEGTRLFLRWAAKKVPVTPEILLLGSPAFVLTPVLCPIVIVVGVCPQWREILTLLSERVSFLVAGFGRLQTTRCDQYCLSPDIDEGLQSIGDTLSHPDIWKCMVLSLSAS